MLRGSTHVYTNASPLGAASCARAWPMGAHAYFSGAPSVGFRFTSSVSMRTTQLRRWLRCTGLSTSQAPTKCVSMCCIHMETTENDPLRSYDHFCLDWEFLKNGRKAPMKAVICTMFPQFLSHMFASRHLVFIRMYYSN